MTCLFCRRPTADFAMFCDKLCEAGYAELARVRYVAKLLTPEQAAQLDWLMSNTPIGGI